MRSEKLPIKSPIYFEGEYKPDNIYDLYIIKFSCVFKLKKNKIPMIQIKHKSEFYSFIPTEYLTSSGNQSVTLTLTNVDFELFKEQYEIEEGTLEFHCGWKFRSFDKLFIEYIDKWMEVKKKATIENNKSMRTLAKLMLNSLYR